MPQSVLIVDDEKSILNSLGGVLSDEGYHVFKAETAERALELVQEEIPDVVMLDIWMPGVSGIEALERIKKYSPHIPVVMISGPRQR